MVNARKGHLLKMKTRKFIMLDLHGYPSGMTVRNGTIFCPITYAVLMILKVSCCFTAIYNLGSVLDENLEIIIYEVDYSISFVLHPVCFVLAASNYHFLSLHSFLDSFTSI